MQDRIWIPYQVGYEFHKNRMKVILSQRKPYEEIRQITKRNTAKWLEDLEKLNLKGNRPHPFINADELVNIVNNAVSAMEEILDRMENEHPNYFEKDQLLYVITKLFKDKVGTPYSQEDQDKLYDEIKRRYELGIPPGFEDLKDKGVPQKGDADPKAYGDAILWLQLIKEVQSRKIPLVFVTSETKDDWWERVSGKTIGPRPQLIKEMLTKTDAKFYMYQTHRFIEYALDALSLSKEEDVVDEVRDINHLRRNWEQLLSSWPSIKNVVSGQNRNLGALLNSGKLVGFEDNLLVVGFDFPLLKDKFLSHPNATSIVSGAIYQVLGISNVVIKVAVTQSKHPANTFEEEEDIPF